MTKSHANEFPVQSCDFRSMSFTSKTDAASETDDCASASFQPLFRSEADGGAANAMHDPAILLEEARQKGSQNGLKNGCEEAFTIARASLRPGLRAFTQTIQSLCTLNEQIQENVSANILELALIIVRQIVGETACISLKEISGLKDSFAQTLAQVNHFVLNMHPDDIAELQAFVVADQVTWPDHPSIEIKSNSSLQPGELLVEEQPLRESLEAQVKEGLAALLSGLRDNASSI